MFFFQQFILFWRACICKINAARNTYCIIYSMLIYFTCVDGFSLLITLFHGVIIKSHLFEHAAHSMNANLTRSVKLSLFHVQHHWTLVVTTIVALVPSVVPPELDVLRSSLLGNSPPGVGEVTAFQLQRKTGCHHHRHHCHQRVPIFRGQMTRTLPKFLFCLRKATSPTRNRLWFSRNPSATSKLTCGTYTRMCTVR